MWDHQWPSRWMCTCHLLFLLLFTYQRVKADFSINSVHLSFHPSPDVVRDTNVVVTCQAKVSTSSGYNPQYEFIINKNNKELHRTTNTSNTYDYLIKAARVSDSGSYQCSLVIGEKKRQSDKGYLNVTGIQTPQMHVDKSNILEGDKVTATCRAPGERGSLIFFFYLNGKEVHIEESLSEESRVQLPLTDSGPNNLTCQYAVKLYIPVESQISKPYIVFVKEIDISVSLTISPSLTIIEADNFTASCMVNSPNQSESVMLIKADNILSQGSSRAEYRKSANASDPGEYMCKVEINGFHKSDHKILKVKELFSKPTLTSHPPEAFKDEYVNFSCQSTNFSSERIKKEEITYSIFKDGEIQPMGKVNGQMRTVRAGPSADGNYTCLAQAKSISKKSAVITFRSKVLASEPEISVKDSQVILGHPFQIWCKSNGTLPIIYTLYRDQIKVNTTSVSSPEEEALFNINISRKEDIHSFWCRAQNQGSKRHADSQRLNAFVVEPLGKPLLITVPVPENIEEGTELFLICRVSRGTPPITFKWFSTGRKAHLYTTIVNANSSYHVIQRMEKIDSGEYYCEALNPANSIKSDRVSIQVKMASWKKGLIVAICLLVVFTLILVFAVRYKTKRGKREAATELSVKPASPKSDDSLTVNMGHDTPFLNKVGVNIEPSVWTERPSSSDSSDQSSTHSHNDPDVEYTEVVHPQPVDPARVPLKKGTDTVYSELQTTPGAPSEHVDNGAVEYAELHHDLPEPVD